MTYEVRFGALKVGSGSMEVMGLESVRGRHLVLKRSGAQYCVEVVDGPLVNKPYRKDELIAAVHQALARRHHPAADHAHAAGELITAFGGHPSLKIGKLVEDLLESRGVGFAGMRAELDRRLELVELSRDVLDRYPIELSGGMKQRMVMVLSTLLNPSLLVADEVTSALDVSTQKAVAETLVGFRDRGFVKSMIVITHDVSLAYQIADSIMVMYAGKLAEKAPTDVLVGSPRHPYTQLLISSLPEVGVRYADRRLTGIPGKPPSLLNPPVGCRFRDRCPLAFDKCVEEPPFVEVERDHFVACWKAI